MEQQINWETLATIGSVVGLVMSGVLWAANKIFKFGETYQRLVTVEQDIEGVQSQVTAARRDFGRGIDKNRVEMAGLSKRIDETLLMIAQHGFTKSNSPRQLTAEGKQILQESGVDKIVREHLDEITADVKSAKPTNAYQVQEQVIQAVNNLLGEEALRDKIEQGSFESGQPVNVVLYLGAIYIRDDVLKRLNLGPGKKPKK